MNSFLDILAKYEKNDKTGYHRFFINRRDMSLTKGKFQILLGIFLKPHYCGLITITLLSVK